MKTSSILRRCAFALLAGTAVAASAIPTPATVLLDQYATLTTSDPTYHRADAGVPCGTLSPFATTVRYQTYTITAAAGVPLYVSLSGFEGVSHVDTFLSVYGPSFDPAAPATNCLGADDDSGFQTDSHVIIPNPAGGTYVIVASTWAPDRYGDYRVCATQGGDVMAACLEVRKQIPTLSEWGLGGLAVLMGLFGTWAARRRRA